MKPPLPQAPEISVVIPFYNEEDNVLPLLSELCPVLDGLGRRYEIVAVNDGSTDATDLRLTEALTIHQELRYLKFRENRGQTAAFEAGFLAAAGDVIITMDGDLQIDPADIPKMLSLLSPGSVDFIYGWRRDRKDDFLKRQSTKVANCVRNWLTREAIRDTGCPLKVFRREVLQRMKLFSGMHRFFITLAHMDGWKSTEMVVNHRPRLHGKSKYGLWNRVFRALRDCLVVRWMMSRHLKYDVAEVQRARSGTAIRAREKITKSEASGAAEA